MPAVLTTSSSDDVVENRGPVDNDDVDDDVVDARGANVRPKVVTTPGLDTHALHLRTEEDAHSAQQANNHTLCNLSVILFFRLCNEL